MRVQSCKGQFVIWLSELKGPYKIVYLLRADSINEMRQHLDGKYGDQNVLHLDRCALPRNVSCAWFDVRRVRLAEWPKAHKVGRSISYPG